MWTPGLGAWGPGHSTPTLLQAAWGGWSTSEGDLFKKIEVEVRSTGVEEGETGVVLIFMMEFVREDSRRNARVEVVVRSTDFKRKGVLEGVEMAARLKRELEEERRVLVAAKMMVDRLRSSWESETRGPLAD